MFYARKTIFALSFSVTFDL